MSGEHVAGASDSTLGEILAQVASSAPAPGAGPSLAWSSALAAALLEMVAAVMLRHAPADPALERRRDRAAELRARALALADEDVRAYTDVLSVLARRDEPGHGRRLRDVLSAAADPPLRIAEVAAEITGSAADAALQARGGVRGEAMTAAVLGEAVVRGVVPILELNLAGATDDPRRARIRELAAAARADLDRAVPPI